MNKQDEARYERNRQHPPRPRDLKPEYVRAYNRGWAAGDQGSINAGMNRGEPSAWFHGFTDYVNEGQKWVSVPDDARLTP